MSMEGDYSNYLNQSTAGAAFNLNPYAAAAGAAYSLYSDYKAKRDYKKALRRARARGTAVIDEQIVPTMDKYLGKASREAQKVPGIVRRGYERAESSLGGAVRGAAHQTVEQGQASIEQGQAALAGQGLMASSVYHNIRSGVGAHTSRALQDLYDNLSRMETSLIEQGTRAQAGATAGLGQFYEREQEARQMPNRLRFQLATMR